MDTITGIGFVLAGMIFLISGYRAVGAYSDPVYRRQIETDDQKVARLEAFETTCSAQLAELQAQLRELQSRLDLHNQTTQTVVHWD